MQLTFPQSGPVYFLARIVICFALGFVGAYAQAPTNYWPLMFVALSGFYVCTAQSERPLVALALGYAFGIGYYVSGLAWIGNAFKVEGNPFSWVMPIAVIGLPMLLSVFPMFTAYISRRFFNLHHFSGLLGFVAVLTFMEWTRGHIFSGFPWNLYGHMWSFLLPAIQITAFTDVFFLTLLTIFWTALPGLLFLHPHFDKSKVILVVLAVATFSGSFALGVWHLRKHPTEFRSDVYFNIVQPNIPQSEKWQRDKMVEAFYKHVELSYAKIPEKATTFVVWPETALTPWFANDRSSMRAIKDSLKSYAGTAYLMTGALRFNEENETNHNSLVLIDDQGQTLQVFDKSHLVPFGEYVPLKQFIPIKPVANFNGFVSGNGPETFETPEKIRYSPMVCYEIIFSGAVIDHKGPRPDFIVNVTNDAWYGDSPGPYQHFVQAMFRAVEEGVPVVRAANTGISGLIDPVGRVIRQSYLFEEVSILERLPKAVAAQNKTPYFGFIILWGSILALFATGLIFKLRSDKF